MTKTLTGKDLLMSTLEIAETNFLMSIKGLNPDLVSKQFNKEINHLAWIVGHCVSHMDSYLSIYSKNRKLSDELREYHAFGASKEDIQEYQFSYKELVDDYLQISENFIGKLNSLPEDHFYIKPYSDARENLYQFVQRLILHIMGHTGQIVLLRRILGDPFWSFVGGVTSEQRNELKQDWLQWWKENKKDYN